MKYLLLIETSTDICSVAIADRTGIQAIRETGRSFSHNEVIAVFIQEVLHEVDSRMTDVCGVVVAQGAGSYTALRIGTATAKGICYAMDIPLISIPTLDILMYGVRPYAREGELIIPMIDARRQEVYQGIYDHMGQPLTEMAPMILDENSFSDHKSVSTIHFCGDGSIKAREILQLQHARFHPIMSSATHMTEKGWKKFDKKHFEDLATYEPNYFKAPNITVQKKNILI